MFYKPMFDFFRRNLIPADVSQIKTEHIAELVKRGGNEKDASGSSVALLPDRHLAVAIDVQRQRRHGSDLMRRVVDERQPGDRLALVLPRRLTRALPPCQASSTAGRG